MSKKLLVPTITFLFLSIISVASAQESSTSSNTTTQTGSTRATAVLTQAAERKSAILTQAASRKEAAASNAAERKEQSHETVLQNLQNRATREIERRVAAMSKLTTKISGLKRVSADQKTALSSQVEAEITNLTNLKAKIQADTDIDTLRTDVKSIISSYRIFALFIPKINILTAGDGLLSANDKLTDVYNDLSTRAADAKTAGSDTTQIETTLAQMKTKIDDAVVQANAAIAAVTPLTPDGFPGNMTVLFTARKSIVAARNDIVDAGHLAREALRSLREKPSMTPALSPAEASPSSTTINTP